jgi:hypothetical protein
LGSKYDVYVLCDIVSIFGFDVDQMASQEDLYLRYIELDKEPNLISA